MIPVSSAHHNEIAQPILIDPFEESVSKFVESWGEVLERLFVDIQRRLLLAIRDPTGSDAKELKKEVIGTQAFEVLVSEYSLHLNTGGALPSSTSQAPR